jgi:AraC family transcriptional regulator
MSTALRIAHGEFGRVALLDMDRSLVRHAHPHCHVLIKASGADTHFAVGDDFVALTDNQAVLVNTWQPHAYVHDPSRPRTIILALYIEPDWLKCFRSNWTANGVAGFFERPAGELSPRIRKLSMDLATVMLDDPAANSTQKQLLSDMMISIIERFTPWRNLSRSLPAFSQSRNPSDWRIRRAIDLIRSDPLAVRDVDALAREVGLSRAHFYRLFEQSTRMTPHIYVNLLRMELAVKTVLHGHESLTAVSEQLGFAAQSHFTRFFRDHAGVNPSEFRHVARMSQTANVAPV